MTISVVAVIMTVCCVSLLYLQVTYIDTLISIRKAYFYEGARRSLNQVAHKLELDEVRKYLAEDNIAYVKKRRFVGGKPTVVSSYSTSTNNGGVVSTITVNTTMPENVALNDEIVLRGLNKALTVEEAQRLQHNTLKIRASLWMSISLSRSKDRYGRLFLLFLYFSVHRRQRRSDASEHLPMLCVKSVLLRSMRSRNISKYCVCPSG